MDADQKLIEAAWKAYGDAPSMPEGWRAAVGVIRREVEKQLTAELSKLRDDVRLSTARVFIIDGDRHPVPAPAPDTKALPCVCPFPRTLCPACNHLCPACAHAEAGVPAPDTKEGT